MSDCSNRMMLERHLERQKELSSVALANISDGTIMASIYHKLEQAELDPSSLNNWVDVVALTTALTLRHEHTPAQLAEAFANTSGLE